MVKHVHGCVGCPPSVGCDKVTCAYWNSVEVVCDECGDYVEDLYWFDDKQLCADCVLKNLEKVDLSEATS